MRNLNKERQCYMVIGCQSVGRVFRLDFHFHGSLCYCYGIVKWLLRDLWLQEHRLVVAGVFCVVARELLGVL